jgi:hypothetical protein
MTKRDQRLIDKFPGKTNEELLMLGLSDKGFLELEELHNNTTEHKHNNAPGATGEIGKEQSNTPAPAHKTKPSMVPNVQRAMPRLSDYLPAPDVSDTLTIRDLKTGRIKAMSAGAAAKLARRYPHEFQLV